MDAFLFWLFAALLAVGSGMVLFSRRPQRAAWGLAWVQTALALFFFLFHAPTLALFQCVAAFVGTRLLLRWVSVPTEEGMILRPFGVVCGLAVAVLFGTFLARAVHGLAGVGHREAVFLFCAGLVGLVARRNLFISLLSLQMLLGAAALLALCGAAAGLELAFSLVAIGLVEGMVGAELLRVFLRERGTLRVEEWTSLKF